MPNFNQSTQEMIGTITGGLRVDTGDLAATLVCDHAPAVSVQLFTVIGRIQVLQLYYEVTTVLDAQISQMTWNATWSEPNVVTVQPIGTKCASITGLLVGHRIVWGGGIIATAAAITTSPGISDQAAVTPIIVGMEDGVGTIGSLCTDATMTSGAMKCSIHYLPMSDGAYVENII